MTPKANSIKEKKKVNSSALQKTPLSKKKSHRLGEYIYKLHICLEYIKNSHDSTRQNNPIRKWAKVLNRHFTKDDILMAHQYRKRFSTSLGKCK